LSIYRLSFPPETLAQYDGRNAIALSESVIVGYLRVPAVFAALSMKTHPELGRTSYFDLGIYYFWWDFLQKLVVY